MDEYDYIGEIKMFAGKFTPPNYMDCDGSLLSFRDPQYVALYTIIGQTYGGDGMTNFALPDLRAYAPVGIGPNSYLGDQSGGPTVILTLDNMPAHTHVATLNVNSGHATDDVPVAGDSIAAPGQSEHGTFTETLGFNGVGPDVTLNSNSVANAPTGSSKPIDIRQPYLGVRYMICVQGIYPTPE